jgi:hypothetical protein
MSEESSEAAPQTGEMWGYLGRVGSAVDLVKRPRYLFGSN